MSFECIGVASRQHVAAKIIKGQWLQHANLRQVGLDALKRHRFTCVQCGFQSRPSRQVPHGWMVPLSLDDPGLVSGRKAQCMCPFCASSHAINWSVVTTIVRGVEQTPGYLIHCPWLSQGELSLLGAYCASLKAHARVGKSNAIEAAARGVDAALTALREEVALNVPVHRGSDSDFARALSLLAPEHYGKRAELIGSLKFWPNLDYWAEQGGYWFKAAVEPLQGALAETLESAV